MKADNSAVDRRDLSSIGVSIQNKEFTFVEVITCLTLTEGRHCRANTVPMEFNFERLNMLLIFQVEQGLLGCKRGQLDR